MTMNEYTPLVTVKPFHGPYPGAAPLFHVYCAEHPDFGYCGERVSADEKANGHRKKHGLEAQAVTTVTAPPATGDEREALARIVQPIIDRTKGQVGTHYQGCHEYHVACLAVLVKEMLTKKDAQ